MTRPKVAGEVMPDVIARLPPIPVEVRITARVIADVVGETMWASGKRPKGLAATCIYLAEVIHDREERMSQQTIDDHSETSYGTIRKHYREIPEVFVQNADEEDVARLDDPSLVMDRLRLFIRAEQHPDDDLGVWNAERLEHPDWESDADA